MRRYKTYVALAVAAVGLCVALVFIAVSPPAQPALAEESCGQYQAKAIQAAEKAERNPVDGNAFRQSYAIIAIAWSNIYHNCKTLR